VAGRVPVTRRDDAAAAMTRRLDPSVEYRHNAIAFLYWERPARTEVDLDIHQD
jgi:hypothetical protein